MLRLAQEKDLETLRQAAVILDFENQRLIAKVAALTQQLLQLQGKDPAELQLRLAKLEEELAKARQQMFGPSTEQRPVPVPAPPPPPEVPPAKPVKGHGPTPQLKLEIQEQVHVLDAPDRQCPQCGGALGEMKGQFEESEEITVVSRKFVVVKHKRQKYRCQCQACVETALGPAKLFPGARYSIEVALDVAVQKYLDHLPLERQARIMGREGLTVTSQTLWELIEHLARLLTPAWKALHEVLLAEAVLGADETRWPLLGAPKGERSASKWHAWILACNHAVYFRIFDNRGNGAAGELLKGFTGHLVTDGHAPYESLRSEGDYVHHACWAHARRKFVELEESFPAESRTAVDLIRELYRVESDCRGLPEAARHELRQARSRPVTERIRRWAVETARTALPRSGLGEALVYLLDRWTQLTLFLDDPAVPLDNNLSERTLRGMVVGRKNHYGSRSRRGTEVAAIFYSLMETAKLRSADPKTWMRQAVLDALDGREIALPPMASVAAAT